MSFEQTVLVTLIGVAVGFLLSTGGQWIGDWRKARREAKSVQIILGIEIDANIEALRKFWGRATDYTGLVLNPNDVPQYTRKLLDTPFPYFNRAVLESQMHLLAHSLGKQQIEQVFKTYNDLDKVKELRDLLAEAQKDIRTGPEHRDSVQRFEAIAGNLWVELVNTVKPLLTSGNPLNN